MYNLAVAIGVKATSEIQAVMSAFDPKQRSNGISNVRFMAQ